MVTRLCIRPIRMVCIFKIFKLVEPGRSDSYVTEPYHVMDDCANHCHSGVDGGAGPASHPTLGWVIGPQPNVCTPTSYQIGTLDACPTPDPLLQNFWRMDLLSLRSTSAIICAGHYISNISSTNSHPESDKRHGLLQRVIIKVWRVE
jgi:hypothetical protein